MTQPTFLCVLAHPDDESFGPAGLIRELHERGVRTVLVTATCGEAGSPGDPPLTEPERLAEFRSAELRAACAILGVDRLVLWEYPDGRLREIEAALLREQIFAVINEEQPAAVLTFGPDGITGHPDHQVISGLATQAFAQYVAIHSAEAPPRLYYITSSGDEGLPEPEPGKPAPLPPTARLDVSRYAEIKRRALEAHATQHQDWGQLIEREEWFKALYLHRAYPPAAANEAPETDLFPDVAPAA
ncbi:MAG TPA: PIG-L family deacetylase [Herpetosiphonaceae bacterium]